MISEVPHRLLVCFPMLCTVNVLCFVQITTVEEAKRFYPLFGLGANIALIFSGRTVKYFSNLRKNLGPGVDGWALSLKGMMSIVVMMGFAICGLYWWTNAYAPLPTRSKKKKVIFCIKTILLIIFQLCCYIACLILFILVPIFHISLFCLLPHYCLSNLSG